MPSEPNPAQTDGGAAHEHRYAQSGVCMLCHLDAEDVQLAPCPYWHAAKAPKDCLRADPFVRCLWCGVDGPGGEDPLAAWNRRAPIPPASPEREAVYRAVDAFLGYLEGIAKRRLAVQSYFFHVREAEIVRKESSNVE